MIEMNNRSETGRRLRRRRRRPRSWPARLVRLAAHVLFLGLLALLLETGLGGLVESSRDTALHVEGAAAGLAENARSRTPSPSPGVVTASPTPSRATPTATQPSAPVRASLSEELRAYVAGLDGTYGIMVRDFGGGQGVEINSGHVFPTASLYKVLVMYRIYDYLEQKKVSLSDKVTLQPDDLVERDEWDHVAAGDRFTVADAVERMITQSSNPAAYSLARLTGGWNPVLAAAATLGMKDTAWDGKDFVSTPTDMLHFFELLSSRSLISPKASEQMTNVLLRQKINDRIPAGLPAGTRVAHKTGELATVRNDAGIVFAPAGPYAIVMMAEGVNPTAASKAEAKISRIVYDHLGK